MSETNDVGRVRRPPSGPDGDGRAARRLVGLIAAGVVAWAIVGTAGCTRWYETTADVTVRAQDIVYLHDERTDLCFAVLFLENKTGTSVRQMSMVPVPCDAVSHVVADGAAHAPEPSTAPVP